MDEHIRPVFASDKPVSLGAAKPLNNSFVLCHKFLPSPPRIPFIFPNATNIRPVAPPHESVAATRMGPLLRKFPRNPRHWSTLRHRKFSRPITASRWQTFQKYFCVGSLVQFLEMNNHLYRLSAVGANEEIVRMESNRHGGMVRNRHGGQDYRPASLHAFELRYFTPLPISNPQWRRCHAHLASAAV